MARRSYRGWRGRPWWSILGLLACGPGLQPSGGTEAGTSTSVGESESSGTTAEPGLDSTSSTGGSETDSPPVTTWCVQESVISDDRELWSARFIDIDGVPPQELWVVDGTRHRGFRWAGHGGDLELLFDVTRDGSFWVLGDINGDARPDAIWANGRNNWWYAADERLGLSEDPLPLTRPAGYGIRALFDFSGDGIPDMVSSPGAYTIIFSQIGDGLGGFTDAGSYNYDPAGEPTTADFYPLGGWDTFLVQYAPCRECGGLRSMAIGSVAPDGSFVEHYRRDEIVGARYAGWAYHDGDDIPDILLVTAEVVPDGPFHLVWLDSTLGPGEQLPVEIEDVGQPDRYDIDGDGMSELFFETAEGTWEVRRWTGSAFGPPEAVIGGGPLRERGYGDLDGDGWTDFLDSVTNESSIVVGAKIWTVLPCDGE